MSDIALRMDAVSLHYGHHLALKNITLNIPIGSLTALIGPNGAGKSSIVKAICARMPISSGEIFIKGQAATKPSARHQLGVAPQRPALYDHLSAEENLISFARQWGMNRRDAKQQAQKTLSIIGMDSHASVLAAKMSGGMRQRTNIGAAIIHAPSVIILDEPSAGLDPQGIEQINTLIAQLKKTGYAILLITHDMEQAETLANEAVIVYEGSIKAVGTPKALISNHCGNKMVVSVSTHSHEPMKKLGFTPSSSTNHIWQKIIDDKDDALNILNRLYTEDVSPDNFSVSSPNLGHALQAAISSETHNNILPA